MNCCYFSIFLYSVDWDVVTGNISDMLPMQVDTLKIENLVVLTVTCAAFFYN